MSKRFIQNGSLLLMSLLLSHSFITAVQAQGFGMFKMDVVLNRKNPPRVYIMGTAINIRVTSQVSKGTTYTGQLASTLESELLSQDNRLKPESNNPETIISCEITRLDAGEKWETRQTKESRKTGERQEWNQKKQKYETKPIYQDVDVTRNYKVINGSISVSYQVKDVRTGAILDSDSFPLVYLKEFLDGNGSPSMNSVENDLVRKVALTIVPRLTPTNEPVKILLSKGKLENIAKLGEAGLWQKMVEGFEMMEALKKPQDDAYRLYNIGVGYEALAYQAEDLQTTKKFLDKASILYNQAIEMKPDEKYFREPQTRIQQAIVQYRKLENQMAEYAKAKALKEQEAALARAAKEQEAIARSRQTSSNNVNSNAQGSKDLQQSGDSLKTPIANQSAKPSLTNQDVIRLTSQGLDETNLIGAIKRAPSVQFNLTPDALVELLQNKVSNTVIAAMRARQEATSGAPRKPRTKKGN
jgi:hypothetical protein